MKCMICNGEMNFYFLKEYDGKEADYLKSADFHKCEKCGFTASKTMLDMSIEEWEKINNGYHAYIEALPAEELIDVQPPYWEQALLLQVLHRNGLVNIHNALDYAGGYGTLSRAVKKYFDVNIPVYDPYVTKKDGKVDYVPAEKVGQYDLVINSAMLEHVRVRSDLDSLNKCVTGGGKGYYSCIRSLSVKYPKDRIGFIPSLRFIVLFIRIKACRFLWNNGGMKLLCSVLRRWFGVCLKRNLRI